MIRELTQNLDIISALENEPNDEGGLSAPELKAKFDESGNTIKKYINETLIPDVAATISDGISAAEIKSGNMPSGGTAGQMLVKNSNDDYDVKFADLPASVEKLKTARAIRTNLASGASAAFDGSADILPGVTGVLQPANGGTGTVSAHDAALSLGRGIGTCSTAAATAAKVVALTGFVRMTGAVAGVKFTNVNTAAGPTLNVNGTGAADIVDSVTGTNVAKSKMSAATHFFQFDGSKWVLLNPTEWKYVSGTVTMPSTSSTPITIELGFTPCALVTHIYKSTMDYFFAAAFAGLAQGTSQFATYANLNSVYAQVTPTATGFTYMVNGPTNGTLYYIAFA